MVSIYSKKPATAGKFFFELRGLSTDEKPTVVKNQKVENGSMFIEINTGKIFLFDLENQQWKEL